MNPWYERAHHRESDQLPLGPLGIEAALRGFGDPTTPEARAFTEARSLSTGPFTRMGARVKGDVIAFPFAAGVKFRRMDTGKRWMTGRFKEHPLNIYYGTQPYARVLVSESETDTAALLTLYPNWDVALMPLGACCWSPLWTAQLASYSAVAAALDNDKAGDVGAALIAAALPQAVRHAPPEGVKDWSAWLAR